ncbi:hypothetical protein OIU91_09120 [Streptomyces sp. NBC_01456]|uniref:hypothetical protein n=1 Tax=unclassified Streptomyces TaxID=2593676 RepID=UPI002E30D357|nr:MULTISPECIES: hypothetical protein [unclassified Streptomyces]
MSLLPRRRPRSRRSRWDTVPEDAQVLGVARTLTSATRLLDVMRLLRPEDGIAVSYTVNPGSVFADGLADYFDGLGARVLSWREATRRRFDLAVACAVHPSMRQLDAPLLVMPHGAGYNRLVTESTGDPGAPAGLSRRELMRGRRVLPAAIGVSHEEQIDRLARTCPQAVPVARLVGDYCWDRIEQSRPRRDLYRARLGVGQGRRLVVVNSTWSEHSLLGRHPDLPAKLVAALPADEFAVALVLHPNVWARHSRHRVHQRLARAMDAGLLVLPPQEGWRAALIASDWVVGDHGSTTFYSAALHRVLLLAATGLDELDPASPTAALSRAAPRLDPDGDLLAQLLAAAEQHRPQRLQAPVDGQLEARGEAGRRLQEVMYPFLAHRNITLPAESPLPDPVPEPHPERRVGPTAFDVTGEVLPDGSVAVRRRPVLAHAAHEAHDHDESRGFLAVTEQETHRLWRSSAEVMARTVTDGELAPADWLRARIHSPRASLDVAVAALAEDRCLLLLRRCGTLLEAHAQRAYGDPGPRLDPLLLGAAVQVWLNARRTAAELSGGLLVRTGPRTLNVAFTWPP